MRFSTRGSGTEAETNGAPADGGVPSTDATAQEVDVLGTPEGGEVASSGSPWVLVARTFAQNKLALIGVAVVVIIILFSFLGPLLDHTDQINPNLIEVNLGPGGGHPLGTDSS